MLLFKSKHHVVGLFAAGALALGSVPPSILQRRTKAASASGCPGFFGSLAATPQQPGWSLANIYYHTSVSAGGGVALAREITIGKIPINLAGEPDRQPKCQGDLGMVIPTYVFATPVLGGQLSVGAVLSYGRVSTSLAGTLTGTLTCQGFGRSRSARDPTASATRCGVSVICSRWFRCVGITVFTTT